jgi:hypothetical protein
MCPTLKSLMELELMLFLRTQDESLDEDEFKDADAEWDRVFRKFREFGGRYKEPLEPPPGVPNPKPWSTKMRGK